MAGNAEIDLPASPYRLLNALDEIGIKSTKEIVYQEILNYGSFGYLEPHFDEYTMLEELNTCLLYTSPDGRLRRDSDGSDPLQAGQRRAVPFG